VDHVFSVGKWAPSVDRRVAVAHRCNQLEGVKESNMDKSELQDQIRRILRNELDDCERALRNEDYDRAKRELDDAITKLKRLSRD
jgi:hypothetical protein